MTVSLSAPVEPATDTRLTTGEAAALLGTSRQHVVDLCTKGYLVFEIAGTHRRIRRGDLEEFRDRTTRMTRDQRRSQWLGTAVAGALVQDPEKLLDAARRRLSTMRESFDVVTNPWLHQWERLLDGPVEEVVAALTSPAPYARELRQNSPFAGAMSQQQRRRVLAGFKADEARSGRTNASA